MKRFLILSALLGSFFTSCSYVSDFDQTSCNVEVDSEFVSGMRAALQKNYDDRTHVRINVECTGSYNTVIWKDATLGTLSNVVFTFDDLPYGKKFNIYVGIYYGSELIYNITQNDIFITSSNPTLELSLLLRKMLNTQYVLYNKDENSRYNFYLTDSPAAGAGGEAFPSDSGYFAFDAEGYFYTINGSAILSNNPDFTNDGLTLPLDEIKSFTIDRVTGLFYFIAGYGDAAKVYKVKRNQISFETPVDFELAFENVNPPARGFYTFAVNNGILYIVLQGKDLYKNNPVLMKADLSTLSAGGKVEGTFLFNLGDYVDMTGNASVSDLLYQNGAIYILEKEFSFPETLNYYDDGYKANSFYSRGVLLKYNLSKASVEKLGWTSNETDTSSGKLHVYYDGNMCYADKDCTIPKTVSKDLLKQFNLEKFNCFPKLFLPDSESSGFYGPQKFIAIKSGKLVFADDGLAFYKNAEAWKYKNINRIVSVDLENFSFSSVNTSVDFDEKQLKSCILSSESHSGSALPLKTWFKQGADVEDAYSLDRYIGIPFEE